MVRSYPEGERGVKKGAGVVLMGERVFLWFSHAVGRRKGEGLGVSRGIGGCQAFFKKIPPPLRA